MVCVYCERQHPEACRRGWQVPSCAPRAAKRLDERAERHGPPSRASQQGTGFHGSGRDWGVSVTTFEGGADDEVREARRGCGPRGAPGAETAESGSGEPSARAEVVLPADRKLRTVAAA